MNRKICAVFLLALSAAVLPACETREPEKKAAAPVPVEATPEAQAPAAEGTFATITERTGTVQVLRGSGTLDGTPGTELAKNDTISSGESSSARLRLHDNAEIWIGPSVTFTLSDYDFPGSRVTVVNLFIGKIRVALSKLARKDRFDVVTGTSVAGVRGTVFEVAAALDGSAIVGVSEGAVDVKSHSGTRKVPSGRQVTVDLTDPKPVESNYAPQSWDGWIGKRNEEALRDPLKFTKLMNGSIDRARDKIPAVIEQTELGQKNLAEAKSPEEIGAAENSVAGNAENLIELQNRIESQMDGIERLLKAAEAGRADEGTMKLLHEQADKARLAEPAVSKARKQIEKIEIMPSGKRTMAPQDAGITVAAAGQPRQEITKAAPVPVERPVQRSSPLIGRPEPRHKPEIVMPKEQKPPEAKVAPPPEKPPEPAKAPVAFEKAPIRRSFGSVSDIRSEFTRTAAKLDMIAVQGEIYDNMTRAAMVRRESQQLEAMLPALSGKISELETKRTSASTAAEGLAALNESGAAQELLSEIREKIVWCDKQAGHYEKME
jgi:hypothetical protein